jgi:hypothetical protein
MKKNKEFQEKISKKNNNDLNYLPYIIIKNETTKGDFIHDLNAEKHIKFNLLEYVCTTLDN